MQNKFSFFRFVAVPAALAWGVMEFFALQRAYWLNRRIH
jgi:hypothetical protein